MTNRKFLEKTSEKESKEESDESSEDSWAFIDHDDDSELCDYNSREDLAIGKSLIEASNDNIQLKELFDYQVGDSDREDLAIGKSLIEASNENIQLKDLSNYQVGDSDSVSDSDDLPSLVSLESSSSEESRKKLIEDEGTENTCSSYVKNDGSNSSLYTTAEDSLDYIPKGFKENFISKQKKLSSQNISSLQTGENVKHPSGVKKYLKFVEDAILKGCNDVEKFMNFINDAVCNDTSKQEQLQLSKFYYFYFEELGSTNYVMDLEQFLKFVETTSWSHMNHGDCDLSREKFEATCEIHTWEPEERMVLQENSFIWQDEFEPFVIRRRVLRATSYHDYHKPLDAGSIENLRKCIMFLRSVPILVKLPLADILTCAVHFRDGHIWASHPQKNSSEAKYDLKNYKHA